MRKIKVIVSCVTMAVFVTMFSGCQQKQENIKTISPKISDIVVNGSEIDFNVNRNFCLYTENPECDKNVKAQKEVKVVLRGKGNLTSEHFDGDIIVEGLELGGNIQGYTLSQTEKGYSITGMGGNSKSIKPVEGKIYCYNIDITEKLDDIKIWVIGMDESNPEEWYWVMQNDKLINS